MAVAIVIPVGPAERELSRVRDLLDSIGTFESGADLRIIAIDDSPVPRQFPAEVDVIIRTPLWEDGRRPFDVNSSMTAGTIEGLLAAERCDWALKLDTDALVIAPFVQAISDGFAGDGLIGSYTVKTGGAVRDFSHWPPIVRRAWWPVHIHRVSSGRPRAHRKSLSASVAALRTLRAATANGYSLGHHCLGGAYAVSRELLARRDLLDWRPWLGTGLTEDVTVGILNAAAGMTMGGRVGYGEPFGLSLPGLPASPADLVAKGHAIVHSVKDQPLGTESELRAWFRDQRNSQR
jgi:hypothetical protein